MTVTAETHPVLAAVPRLLLIGDEWTCGAGSATMCVTDPATARPIAEVVDAEAADGRSALAAAVAAAAEWSATAPRRRSDILRAAYDLILSGQKTSPP